jgi:hypothetical protein
MEFTYPNVVNSAEHKKSMSSTNESNSISEKEFEIKGDVNPTFMENHFEDSIKIEQRNLHISKFIEKSDPTHIDVIQLFDPMNGVNSHTLIQKIDH